MDNKKASIIMTEPLRKAVNLSMIIEDQDFLICQILSSGEGIMWESAEVHRGVVGRHCRVPEASVVLTFMITQHRGLREMCFCGAN